MNKYRKQSVIWKIVYKICLKITEVSDKYDNSLFSFIDLNFVGRRLQSYT